ncbi:MAG: ParB/RepB/Spo0J family partition protein [Clostridia bacterium]|nr:ParB/RepB/Spo0J family partition protein [Clostridia bacterium]
MTAIQEIFKKAEQLQIETEKAKLRRAKEELERREKEFDETEEFGRIHMIPSDHIFPNPNQPRRKFEDDSIIRLADSIRRYGILQPLTVRRTEGEGIRNALFEIVAGERRFRAAKLLGLSSVPCIIIKVDDRKSAELAIIENIQRENLNIFEQASAIASLIDMYGLTQDDVAKQLSTSQSFVANKLRILRLTIPEREKILAYGLTERHARALLRVASAEERLRIIDYINTNSLNVATTESYIDRYLSENENARKPRSPRKLVLKDMRIFYNSIDRAISIVKQAGINVETERVDGVDSIELTIRIPKNANVSRETFVDNE